MDESELGRRINTLDHFQKGAEDSTVGSCSLAVTSVGDRVQVISIQGDSQLTRRLINMGITVNVQGTIVSQAKGGTVVFARDGCRLGLDSAMAQQIFVKVISQTSLDKSSSSRSSLNKSFKPFRSLKLSMNQNMNQKTSGTLTSKPLNELSVGDSGSVVGYEKGNRAYRKKLLAMGLTPGTSFTITQQAPMGDPIELQVRGFKLSLRKGEAAALQVELEGATS